MDSLRTQAELGTLSPSAALSLFEGEVSEAAAACAALSKPLRTSLLNSWMFWTGLADTTKRGALRDFKRILSNSAPAPAPAPAAAAIQRPSDSASISALRQRIMMFQELEMSLDPQFGCSSQSELADLLASASQHDLREAALRTRTGLGVPSDNLVEFFVRNATFESSIRSTKLRRTSAASVSSDASSTRSRPSTSRAPAFPDSPLRRAPPRAGAGADSMSSSSDSYDSDDIADARPVRTLLQLPLPPPPGAGGPLGPVGPT